MTKMKIIFTIFLIAIVSLIKSDELVEEEEKSIKSDLEMLNRIKNNNKRFACLALIRNSLNQGNLKIKDIIKNTSLDKSDVFDKILIQMLNNCETKIKENQIDEVVNINNIDVFNTKFSYLIDFDDKVFSNKNEKLIFDEQELQALDDIHDVKAPKTNEAKLQEEDMITLKTYEEEKQAFMIYGATVAALAFVLIVATGKLFF